MAEYCTNCKELADGLAQKTEACADLLAMVGELVEVSEVLLRVKRDGHLRCEELDWMNATILEAKNLLPKGTEAEREGR